jgi:hypothetical protein
MKFLMYDWPREVGIILAANQYTKGTVPFVYFKGGVSFPFSRICNSPERNYQSFIVFVSFDFAPIPSWVSPSHLLFLLHPSCGNSGWCRRAG